ncbi:MAG TPA: hypothetical protein VG847_16965 [Chitinophagaceae bacterium]|nr:hypothetical protein [Chitinophagaceae bacterium]
MQKVIIPLEGAGLSEGAFSFARMLHEHNPVMIAGVFLPEVDYARFFFFPSAFTAPAYIPLNEKVDEEGLSKNIDHFTSLCEKYNITYRVHKGLYDAAIHHLTKETRFADMMIIGSEAFYTVGSGGPLEYLKEALRDTECPVIIVPEKFDRPKQIILAYDGTAACVYAIRQFVNLFPSLCSLPATLVYVADKNNDIPEKELIEELLTCHFKNPDVSKIAGAEKSNFYNWLTSRESPLLVSGSFGRSGISELFSKGFVVDAIRQHKTPIFIAHQ